MDFLIHLAKSSLFLILFYICYRILLRHTTFFHLNRAYLLVALAVSPLLPFIRIEERVVISGDKQPWYPEAAAPGGVIAEAIPPEMEVVSKGMLFSTENVLLLIYGAGFIIFLVLFIRRLYGVSKLARCYSKPIGEDLPVRVGVCHDNIGSFSFFGRIFMTRSDFDHHFEKVYQHEKVHVDQRHSLDIILAELLQVVFWFNPVLREYKRLLQEVHEFLADRSANDKESYARFLVTYAMSGGGTNSLAHTFFNAHSLKMRITMLYKQPDSGAALGRYLLVVPLVITLFFLSASRQYIYQLPVPEVYPYRDDSRRPIPLMEEASVGEGGSKSGINQGDSPTILLKEEAGQVREGALLVSGKAEHVPAAIEQADRKVSGVVLDASDKKPLPGAVVVITGTQRGVTTDADGRFSLEVPDNVPASLVVSFVGFQTQTVTIGDQTRMEIALAKAGTRLNEVVVVGYGFVDRGNSGTEAGKAGADTSGAWSVVEAMPEFPGGQEELYRFLRRNIRYPGEASRANIEGKVFVSFVVNRLGHIRNPKVLRGVGYGLDEEALRVVISMPSWTPGRQNGEPVDVEYTLPVTFRLEVAEEKRQGRADKETDTPYFASPAELIRFRSESGVRATYDPAEKPLFLLEGKEVFNLDRLDPADIESIEVIKNEGAISQYGEKAKNGVILITLKKKR